MGFLISSGLLLGNGATWRALICAPKDSEVIPLAVPSDIIESPVSSGGPIGVAITPDSTKALVTNGGTNTVGVLDLTQPIIGPGYTTPVGDEPEGIAITPDGNLALVTNAGDNTVSVLELNPTVHVVDTISVGGGPRGVAITPDGSKALVANFSDGTVSVLSLNPTVQSLYAITGFTTPKSIAITPDGTKALVVDIGSSSVTVLDLTQSIIGSRYLVSVGSGASPSDVAITPDGRLALVTIQNLNSVAVLDLTQPTIVSGYSVPGVPDPESIAITPDGMRAYVVGSAGPVVALDLSSTPAQVVDTMPIQTVLLGIAITPDQAPTSLFTMAINGLTVLFDGSGSSSPVGNVKEYIWDFGDGSSPVTTTTATVSHTYANSAAYTVTLTVVNDAGTSLDITFTGQTVSNHGLPRARSTQALDLPPLPPHKFVGKVHKHDHKLFLKTKWHPSTDKGTKKYEITARNRKEKTIHGRKSDHATIKLHPHHVPHHISKKYRLYLHDKYAIRSVNANGFASQPVMVHVKD
jgi:YVTN family beta-propeller protein